MTFCNSFLCGKYHFLYDNVMSVNDPLLKLLKGSVLDVIKTDTDKSFIEDSNVNLIKCCEILEKIFNEGIQVEGKFFFKKPAEPWYWLQDAARKGNNFLSYQYSNAIRRVKENDSLKSNAGRLRALIRCCLQYGCLHIPVQFLITNRNKISPYKVNSILGDEILREIFLSVLLQIGNIEFKLDVSNTSFLDDTWELPETIVMELVPCKNLGLSLSFVQGKALIVQIKTNSVIGDKKLVHKGDILDNLNGTHVCLALNVNLHSLLKKGQPVLVTIIKARNSITDEIYRPIAEMIKQMRLDPFDYLNYSRKIRTAKKDNNCPGLPLKYVGYCLVGPMGDVFQIDDSFINLACPYRHNNIDKIIVKKLVHLEIGELGITIRNSNTSEILLLHSYMELSACRSVSMAPNYVGFIAGDGYCDVATDFACHIFHTKDTEIISTITEGIEQGIRRTNFAV